MSAQIAQCKTTALAWRCDRISRVRSGDLGPAIDRAAGDRQHAAIGDQGGGRVWLFLETEDFDRDHRNMLAKGVTFEGAPRDEPYGRVAVWQDPWGNRWDLIQFSRPDHLGTAQA